MMIMKNELAFSKSSAKAESSQRDTETKTERLRKDRIMVSKYCRKRGLTITSVAKLIRRECNNTSKQFEQKIKDRIKNIKDNLKKNWHYSDNKIDEFIKYYKGRMTTRDEVLFENIIELEKLKQNLLKNDDNG